MRQVEHSHAHINELSAEERVELERLRGARRRAEWVAGRVAAKQAIIALEPASRPSILTTGTGAPKVSGASAGIQVSITHGRAIAFAVAASGQPLGPHGGLGVDFCEWSRAGQIQSVAPRFMPEELRLHRTRWSDRSWVKAWALKEASLKAHGLGLLSGGLLDARIPSVLTVQSVERGQAQVADPELCSEILELEVGALAVVLKRRSEHPNSIFLC